MGMGMTRVLAGPLPPETFCALVNCLTDACVALIGDGTYGSGHGIPYNGAEPVPIEQDYGYGKAVRKYLDVILDSKQHHLHEALGGTVHTVARRGGHRQLCKNLLHQVVKDLEGAVMRAGLPVPIRGINAFATFYNFGPGGPWNALISPEFAVLYHDIYGLVPRDEMPPPNPHAPPVYHAQFDPRNIYAPPVDLGRSLPGAGFAPSAGIDSNAYAGAASLEGVVTDWIGPPATLSVMGMARTAAGSLLRDRSWVAPVTGDGTVVFAPSVPGDLCVSVQSIAWPAGVTAGLTVRAARPVR